MSQATLFHDASGAEFSACRRYRYRLWRCWDANRPTMVCIMLNPSVADEVEVDATITRCIARAKRLGFGRLEVLNLFAFVSTDRSALRSIDDPVGPENDTAIMAACRGAETVLCAWGADGRLKGRDQSVLAQLKAIGVTVSALTINKDGTPKHPLYVGNGVDPATWLPSAEST